MKRISYLGPVEPSPDPLNYSAPTSRFMFECERVEW